MNKKTLIFLVFIVATTATSCAPAQSIDPEIARQTAANAWKTDQHTVWELDWPNAPIGSPLTVETWQAGNRYRYEILESNAPAFIGQTLTFDGQSGWLYNRLDPPKILAPTRPALPPVTDAIGIINHLLDTPPQTATQEATVKNSVPVQKIVLTYANDDTLTLWQDEQTKLPLKVEFSTGNQQGTIETRSVEKLVNPLPELFSVGEWTQNK